jgi:hypothetical protein
MGDPLCRWCGVSGNQDLIAHWTLVEQDWQLVANKSGATRLGFSALLKFFEVEGRFPEYTAEVPERAVAYLAEQVNVDAVLFAKYDLSSRSAKYHRMQIREELGFRSVRRSSVAAQSPTWPGCSSTTCPTGTATAPAS